MKQEHNRVTPEGQALGRELVRLVQPVLRRLAREGEADTRCKSCAFRLETVPNGCPQTQMDALKCVMEGVPFYCHATRTADGERPLCHGYYAARVALHGTTVAMPWTFSTDAPLEEGEHHA
jgi:hypothetical protein